MKRMIIFMTAFVIILTMLPATAAKSFAADSDFTVVDGELKGYTGTSQEVVIPDNLGITIIGDNVFSQCSGLTSIVIPDGVLYVGPFAFSGCIGLKKVVLPDSITYIDSGAFSECSSLTDVEIPDGVDSIQSWTFLGCNSLKNITIPRGVTRIGFQAFSGCSALTDVVIPGSVTYIRDNAFLDCVNLASVTFLGDAPGTDADVFLNTADALKIFYLEGKTGYGSNSELPVRRAQMESFSIGLTLDKTNILLSQAGAEEQLTAAVLPVGITTVNWSTDNAEVATVDQTGNVTAVGCGIATITATVADGGKAASCGVRVEETEMDKMQGFVRRLYEKMLGRTADPEGLEYYSRSLAERELTGEEIGKRFLLSSEFQNRNLSNAEFLEVLYEAFMNRSSDEDGKNYWKNFLDNGISREHVLLEFLNSAEYADRCEEAGICAKIQNEELDDSVLNPELTLFISHLYEKALGRQAETEGIAYYTREILEGNMKPEDMAKNIIASEEFRNRSLSDEDYIKVLYQAFMAREFDQSGLDYYLGKMEDGEDRTDILTGFICSPEFRGIINRIGL